MPSFARLRPLLLALLAALILLGPALHAHAQSSRYTVSGLAWFDRNRNGTRESDEPLIGETVVNVQPFGQASFNILSDMEGRFSVTEVPAGKLALQGYLPGWNPASPLLISAARTLTVTANLSDADLALTLPITVRDQRFFAQTGFRIDNEEIWDYFIARGGVDSFGYPVSRTFKMHGFWTQIFQRHVISVGSTARPMNLLDETMIPLTRLNGSTFPAYDRALANRAPFFDTPDYGQAVLSHLQATVPNGWQGQPVDFLASYLDAAQPSGVPSSSPIYPLIALEIWGFPTSHPMRDPNNSNFIYQRFQRGILHFDAATGVTRGILLGDAFKSLLTRENLPTDLANDLARSPYYGLYEPTQLNAVKPGLSRSELTALYTNLAYAFVKE